MTIENMLILAKKHLKTALLFGMLVGALSFLTLVMTQKNFRSDMDIIVSQNQSGSTDFYALSQSANYLTNILSQSIYSEKFLDEVNASGKVSSNFLVGSNTAQKLKTWRRIIRVKKNSNVGIMSIEIFGDTPDQVKQISQAVINVLVNQNSYFLGQNKNVNAHVLSGPIVEKNPSFFQIVLTSTSGFAVGIILVLFWALYQEEYKKQKKFEDKIIINNENIPAKEINGEEYLSADSDYWKKRLENNHL